jgi:uncharacterized MAPEG superfamily protein
MTALEWLAAAALMTALFWVPYVLERMVALGVMGAMKPVDPEDELKQALWARRAKRAHYNGVENLAVFATLVLVAFAMGKGDEHGILVASQVYFWARLVPERKRWYKAHRCQARFSFTGPMGTQAT